MTFTPTSVTPPARSAKLTFTDTETGGSQETQVVDLSGIAGSAPIVSLSPSSLAFSSDQAVGVTSAPLILTVTNTGTAALSISSILASGEFAVQSTTCAVPLQATTPNYSNCTINVTFTPTAPGPSVGSLTLTDNAPDSPQIILLTGNGVLQSAAVLSASTLNFGGQILNTTSAAQTVTVTNTGTAALTPISIAAAAPFTQMNTCGSSLAPGGICTVSVTFTPTTGGNAAGAVTLNDNAPNSPQAIALIGTGITVPIAALSPSSVTFTTSQLVGTTSAPTPVMLTNTGTASLTISAITTTGPFGVAAAGTSCSPAVPVAVNGTCTVAVNFTPTTGGSLYGALTVTDNNNGAAASTQVVPLNGTGTGAPSVGLSSASLTFSTTQPVGVTSAPQALTVTNTGTAALALSSVTASGDFAVLYNNCSTVPLQVTTPPSNCTITVTFTPTLAGARTGALTLTDNAANSPQVVLLTGTGVAEPIVGLSATTLSFPGQFVNTTSLPQTVTVTNSGTSTLNFTSISATAPFAQTNTCSLPIAPQGGCAISVTFTPTAAGSVAGSVTLTDNAGNSPQTIALAGTGTSAPTAALSPLSLTFAAQPLQTTSAEQAVTVTNTGNAPLLITGITASTSFGATTTCGSSIAAGANCSVSVTFTPTAAGSIFGTLTVTDNSNGTVGSTQTVALEGTGQGGPVATIAPSTLTFAAQPLSTTSALQSVTLTNSGTATMTGISVGVSGDFSQSNTCPATLTAGASCTINVTFTPTVVGTRTGALTITDSAPNSPQRVTLTGGGADFSISANPTSATVVAGNPTSVTVSVSSVSGFNAAVGFACSGLPALATCGASPATVTPGATGAATSTLKITTTRRTSMPPRGLPRPQGPGWTARPGIWWLWALLLLGLSGLAARRNRWRWSWATLALIALWLASFAACGGGGGTGYTDPTGTPAGSYTIVITGSSGSLSHSTDFTLTVQ